MKTTAFGISGLAIVLFTVLAVLQLCTGHTRTTNLQDNLQQALESSLKTAMDSGKSYDINTDEELIADVLEGIAMRLDDNCELRLEVNEVDRSLGILSVKATATYMTRNQDVNGDGVIDENDRLTDGDVNGDGIINDLDKDTNRDGVIDDQDIPETDITSTVTAEHTIIMEQFDMTQAGKHLITYKIINDDGTTAIYKKYSLTKDMNLMAPKNAPAVFDGHWYLGDQPYTPDEIRAMTLDQDYIFTNKPTS